MNQFKCINASHNNNTNSMTIENQIEWITAYKSHLIEIVAAAIQ